MDRESIRRRERKREREREREREIKRIKKEKKEIVTLRERESFKCTD